ncbi:MAG: hypothetical protein V3V03_02975 [Hyphomonadaceae bacterium]
MLAGFAGSRPANASWIDSDFYCRAYGCVVVHDGYSFDVYDVYNFNTGGTVPADSELIPWTGNPFQGAGGVNPVITGTRTEGFHTAPLQDESVILGIDQTGNGEIDFSPTGNADGFLDATGAFQSFAMTEQTDLVSADTSSQRSFYLSSRTDFYLTAQAFTLGPADDLNAPAQFDNIDFSFGITRRGNDDGMSFGADARRGRNYIRPVNGINTLGDIYGAPTNIIEFRRDIRRRNSSSLPEQSVRYDYVYGFQGYDLSMGAGHLQYRIEYTFRNR